VGLDSSVDVVTCYGLDSFGIESRWGRDFPHPSVPTRGSTHPPMQLVPGPFHRVKRPGRGVDYPHLSSAEVKAIVELYLQSFSGPSRFVVG
jgi:hypothetical protein